MKAMRRGKAGVAAPAEYTLILQGRGNNCDAAVISCPGAWTSAESKADFAFTGELITGGSENPSPAAEPDADAG